jgi:hypothetical protein
VNSLRAIVLLKRISAFDVCERAALPQPRSNDSLMAAMGESDEGMALAWAEYVGIKSLTSLLVLVAFLAVTASAPAGGISDQPCMNVSGENTNTCPTGKVGAPYLIKFVESEGSGCGPGRQTFHFDSGELPPELTLAPDGTLSGIPTRAGTFQFYVEMREPQDDPMHCAGKRTQKQFTLRICEQPGIVSSPALPPRAEVRVPFRMTHSSCGGVGALTWTLAAGVLPAGLTLRADGSITGAPKVAGTYRFVVAATDIRGGVASRAAMISVAPSLRVQTSQLPPARVGRFYWVRVAEAGGVASKVWTITRGRLPRGIRLDTTHGVLSGVAQKPGMHRVTVEIRDGLKVKATRTFTFVVLGSVALRPSRRT